MPLEDTHRYLVFARGQRFFAKSFQCELQALVSYVAGQAFIVIGRFAKMLAA
jgi:hypothetical protein